VTLKGRLPDGLDFGQMVDHKDDTGIKHCTVTEWTEAMALE